MEVKKMFGKTNLEISHVSELPHEDATAREVATAFRNALKWKERNR
jgi:hypothetical protein